VGEGGGGGGEENALANITHMALLAAIKSGHENQRLE